MLFPVWKYPVHFLAVGCGAGLIPFAPGTFGSLVGVALYWFAMAPLGAAGYAAAGGVLGVIGVGICAQTARDFDKPDPGFIVFDEIVGFLVAMYLLPVSWRWVLAAFVLFRLFDIWKPWPIPLAEQKLGLGGGIMADDIIAGLYTLAILHSVHYLIARATS